MSAKGSCWELFSRIVKKPFQHRTPLPHPVSTADAGTRPLPLIAYRTHLKGPAIVVASAERRWMNDTTFGFANRCLPLRMANQAGWFLLNDRRIDLVWHGGKSPADLMITYYKRSPFEDIRTQEMYARSHFGHGIVTWRIPYLFCTPAGYNLFVRGPTNWCKRGAVPLDAVVESDWSVATFTMNWKLTEVGERISFDEGEPICMIIPERRGCAEQFEPEIRELAENPELEVDYRTWSHSREEFLEEVGKPGSPPFWQKDYYLGRVPKGRLFSQHQLKVRLRPFRNIREATKTKCSVSPAILGDSVSLPQPTCPAKTCSESLSPKREE